MSFLLKCPNCGQRSVYEFRWGGEYRKRPLRDATDTQWVEYIYFRNNLNALQKEWWYHRDGCGEWFLAERNPVSNSVLSTEWPRDALEGDHD